ncbi:MAG: indolepyruvate oxidoreductase subunit beta family protein [Proteobacteria bacterium]|nr:indolepyruvate oxidoreductase subunit beta family protein [Pseudomonadota bacterium]
MITISRERPITIAILALGGLGGGVLTKWLVDMAEANGFLAQSTYVAGVAQRTGSTVYCIEMYAADKAQEQGRTPVFALYPVPGDVDLVVAGEMAETGRAIQKGFVTPNTTTLIASSHRVFSIIEKEAVDDGIVDQAPVAEVAAKVAKKFICFDMEVLANETGSVISSVLFGAIAATDALPFDKGAYEKVIRDTGRAVDRNLAGFAAGFTGASRPAPAAKKEEVPQAEPVGANGRALARRIDNELPAATRVFALHGALRALDYQDAGYANSYLDTLTRVHEAEAKVAGESRQFSLTTEVARQLALQMCYEDTIRVADLKTRHRGCDRLEFSPDLRGSVRLHIEHVHVRWTAQQVEQQDRANPSRGPRGTSRPQHPWQRHPAKQRQGTDLY